MLVSSHGCPSEHAFIYDEKKKMSCIAAIIFGKLYKFCPVHRKMLFLLQDITCISYCVVGVLEREVDEVDISNVFWNTIIILDVVTKIYTFTSTGEMEVEEYDNKLYYDMVNLM